MLELPGVATQVDYRLGGVLLLPVLREPADCFACPMLWRVNYWGQRAPVQRENRRASQPFFCMR